MAYKSSINTYKSKSPVRDNKYFTFKEYPRYHYAKPVPTVDKLAPPGIPI